MLNTMKLVPIRTGMFLVALAAAWPAAADTQFQIRRTNRDDIPLGKGQCDIRLQVDNEVEVSVVRDTVRIRTISGRDAFDDGSECNAPLPDRDMEGFGFDVRDRRNEIPVAGRAVGAATIFKPWSAFATLRAGRAAIISASRGT